MVTSVGGCEAVKREKWCSAGPQTQAQELSCLRAQPHCHGSSCLPRIQPFFVVSPMRWGCGTLQNGNTRHVFLNSTSSEIAYDSHMFSHQAVSDEVNSAERQAFSRFHTAQAANVAEATDANTFQDQPSTSGRANETPLPAHQGLSESQLQSNKVLISRLQGKLVLAPLTKYA